MKIIVQQMTIVGRRKPTIDQYQTTIRLLKKATDVEYLDDVNAEIIYQFLNLMPNANAETKASRLRVLKAILNKCYDNGWIEKKFWKEISIKVDKSVKKASSENDISILLSLMNVDDFVGFRDYVAVKLLYTTGNRIGTLAKLESGNINFDTKEIIMDGEILKNHKAIEELESKLRELKGE